MSTPKVWTKPRIAKLKQMRAEGYSAALIARALGGVTRSAVLGKAHRLDVALGKPVKKKERVLRQKQGRPKGTKPSTTAQRVVVPFTPRQAQTPLPPLMLSLDELTERTCKYPLGDPRAPDFAFCGVDIAWGEIYCGFHQGICWNEPPPPKSKRPHPRCAA